MEINMEIINVKLKYKRTIEKEYHIKAPIDLKEVEDWIEQHEEHQTLEEYLAEQDGATWEDLKEEGFETGFDITKEEFIKQKKEEDGPFTVEQRTEYVKQFLDEFVSTYSEDADYFYYEHREIMDRDCVQETEEVDLIGKAEVLI
tara:strand:+ start:517 stop:951 length:435 start_codon:yes stop_codon:yes gene_type:complete